MNLWLDLIKLIQILLILFSFQKFRAMQRVSDRVKRSHVRGYLYKTIMLNNAWPIIG